jgi:oligoendopeptidase F
MTADLDPSAAPTDNFSALDPADTAALQGVIDALLADPVDEPAALEGFLLRSGALSARVLGESSRRLVAMNRDTEDATKMESVVHFQREVGPVWERAADQLNRRLLDSPAAPALPPYFSVYRRDAVAAKELFREENIELGVQEAELGNRYQQLAGAALVELDGEQVPVPVARQLLQEPDRALREKVWRAWMDRASADADAVDDIFDEMVQVRTRIAANAGFPPTAGGYVAYQFKAMARHDYSPADCRRFHEAVEARVVPALHRIAALRRARLGLDQLRPWDLSVSLLGEGATQPFRGDARLRGVARAVFAAVDPSFAADFDRLDGGGRLDLDARAAKAPGAYMADIADEPLPFIFANSTGSRRDLMTLLHEGGHAFHALLARAQPLMAYRWAPTEFSEVASMSMELLGLDVMGALPPGPDGAPLVSEADLRELRAEALLHIIGLFPMVARLDAFQHEVYGQPDMGRAERRALWARLDARFAPTADWSGLEALRGIGWQGVPHPFTHPLYFIEYAIAQLGALQLRANARRDRAGAVEAYRRALQLGGSQPLDQLFVAAGARLVFDEQGLEELVLPVVDELEALLGG